MEKSQEISEMTEMCRSTYNHYINRNHYVFLGLLPDESRIKLILQYIGTTFPINRDILQ